VRAARLLDGLTDRVRTGQAVLVRGERIAAVGPADSVLAAAGPGVRVVDLGDATLVPGLVDAHTHVLLQGDITAAEYDDQLLKESIPYRAIRATAAARRALDQGFTTIRDLETEGAMYADVDVKTAIERGVVPGPRMFVATRAFAPTGMYGPSGYSWELGGLPRGVQIVDGADAIRRAVREQVANGADWIKVYTDRRYSLGADGRLRSMVNYTDEELRAFVDEARRLGRRTAAHAMAWDGIDAALRAGFTSIEHGVGMTDDLLDRMARQGTYWCPTMFVVDYVAEGRGGVWREMPRLSVAAVGRGVRRGVRIANGSDAGGYAWDQPMARELGYLVRAGMTPAQAVRAATGVAAELLDQTANLGAISVGRYADLAAAPGDVSRDVSALERVTFVMKGGRVVRGAGAP
jgi:imidazolonepropionase-like amidohydrolase